jgi:hypothetical protein
MSQEACLFKRPSNLNLCMTLFYLTNYAHAHNDEKGAEIYISAMKGILRSQAFSTVEVNQVMTQMFVLYGSKKPDKRGLIRLPKER